MKKYIYFILLLIIFSLSFFTFAESASQVTRFSPNEGLAQSSVRSLLVDNQGYLWIATEGGLNRYDGYTLSNVSDPDGLLRDEPIEFIYEDTQGDIWISTLVSGLFHYQLESSTFTRVLDFKTDYTHSPITMLEAHHKGYYWLGRVGDLALLNAATGEVKSVVDIPSKYDQIGIRKLKYYKHYLLIATSEGLFVLDTRTRKLVDVTFLNEPLIHHDQENTKSFHLMGDMLWLGTVQGLHKIDLTNIDL